MSKDELTLKNKDHLKFVLGYLATGDRIRSYMDAYPKCTTEESAAVSSSRILSQPEVQEFIDHYLLNSATAAGVSIIDNKDRAYLELESMAFSHDSKYPPTKLDALKKYIDLIFLEEELAQKRTLERTIEEAKQAKSTNEEQVNKEKSEKDESTNREK